MRAIIINPYLQTVTEEDISGDIKDWYALLRERDPLFRSNMVELQRMGDDIDLWIDEEGCLEDGRPVFEFKQGPSYAGVCFLLSHDDNGDSRALPDWMKLPMVASRIAWTGLVTTGDFGPASRSQGPGPLGPKTTTITMGGPIYRTPAGYQIWCLEDHGDGEPENFVSASSKVFETRTAALAYAATIAPQRKAQVREAPAMPDADETVTH